jgi:hypothetical protein
VENANIIDVVTEATNRWKIQNTSKTLSIETNISNPAFTVDVAQMRQIISHLLTFASIRVTEGTVSLSARDLNDTLEIRVQSRGNKPVDRSEMDSAMLGFITSSLIKLHGGQMDEPQELDDGLLLRFSLSR